MSVSPLAPAAFPAIPPVAGVRLATHAAGLRYQRRADLMLATMPAGTAVAGAFTRSLCPSAPVDWCRRILSRGTARAVVCNAGNANAFTGRAGDTAAALTARLIAAALGCDAHDVYLASTGVIGETLDETALAEALPILAGGDEATWEQAADAIRTTDTYPKGSFRCLDGAEGIRWQQPAGEGGDAEGGHGTGGPRAGAGGPRAGDGTAGDGGHGPGNGGRAVVAGIAKGSGMIAPDMATMLGFVFTDLAVSHGALQAALADSVERSYNRISVDSDTSTSDTVLAFATGAAGNEPLTDPASPGWDQFVEALDAVNLDLAHQIVRDGEGASKFVEVAVTGAEHDVAAKAIALAIANSPLVKTALAAGDANWGRIVMAVGKAGQRADRDALAIWIGNEQVAAAGEVCDSYSEARATGHLAGSEVTIAVDVGVGDGQASVWTCDLTHGYIDINAGYRS